jgi:hypothetical protein
MAISLRRPDHRYHLDFWKVAHACEAPVCQFWRAMTEYRNYFRPLRFPLKMIM